jgi:hypothetical protein
VESLIHGRSWTNVSIPRDNHVVCLDPTDSVFLAGSFSFSGI